MHVDLTTDALHDLDVDTLILPVWADDWAEAQTRLAERVARGVERVGEEFRGAVGDAAMLYPERGAARRIVLLGLGERAACSPDAVRRAAARGVSRATGRVLAVDLPDSPLGPSGTAEAVVEGAVLGSYRYDRYRTQGVKEPGPDVLRIHLGDADREAAGSGVRRGQALAESTTLARDLINQSPGEQTPTELAAAARAALEPHGVRAEIWDKARIVEEGMGGLLAVNRGSIDPPTFSVFEWKPERPVNDRPIVLAGKGVVYDTGGLSLKSTKGSMDRMKYDMSGAAAVIGATAAVARLGLPVHVLTLVPSSDNRPGGNAYVPGEVITMHSGLTVEVLNTDAEGRLLLADALSYARRFNPELVVDVATLTGAQVVALGRLAAAIMTNDAPGADDRLETFQSAGEYTGDRVAPLPMYAEYAALLESDVADLKNVGGREAGSITAGKFLERFTDYPWVHLDIAGPAFLEKPDGYRPKGGTGYGVRLIAEVIRRRAGHART